MTSRSDLVRPDASLYLNPPEAAVVLVLARLTQAMDGDHLIFRSRSGRREYAVSLHAWEPLTEAAATLGVGVAT